MAAADDVDPLPSLSVSIPAPRDRQDGLVRGALAPLVAVLREDPGLESLHFERFNKPDWRLVLRVFGKPSWLDGGARRLLDRWLGGAAGRGAIERFEFVPAESDEKWTGGDREMPFLRGIYADTLACLDLLQAEARGALSRPRAEWSLVLVERMLDRFGLVGSARLDFYRRGYLWEIDQGRWDEGVMRSLEDKYRAQREPLVALLRRLDEGDAPEAWGGAEQARIALRWLDDLRAPVEAIRTARASGRLERDLVDLAVFVGHAHSNRLGIHAVQEAVMRWLVRRARTDERG